MKVNLCQNGAYWLARWKTGSKSLGPRANIDREHALAACRDIEAGLADCAGPTSPPAPSLGSWVKTFLELKPGLNPKSAALYRSCGERLCGFLEANIALVAVSALDAMRFRAFLGAEGSGLGESTVYRLCTEAKAMFGAAVDADILAKNPFRRAMPPKPRPDRKWAWVGPDTLERLIGVSPSGWRVLAGLLRLGGLRLGEALGLTWLNVDLVRRRIIVQSGRRYQSTKKRTREVPITPRLYDLLWEASMEDRADGDQRVLAGMRSGNLFREFRAICRKAGVEPWARWAHTMRKCAETDWAREHPIHVVADFLGNSSQVALERYLKAEETDFEKAAGLVTNDFINHPANEVSKRL